MRSVVLPSAAWLGALNVLSPMATVGLDWARMIGTASVLGTVTVLVYRLGVWRQDMEHTRHSVVTEVKAHRHESTELLARIERHLEAVDHLLSTIIDNQARMARRQIRIERRVERLESGRVEP